MLRQFELNKIKDGRFYSESQKCFVEINGKQFTIGNDLVIDLVNVSILDEKTQDMISEIISDSSTKYRIEKEKNYKDAVLLGINSEGIKEWLQPPKWDCGWYWGFGYIQTPHSHTHFSSLVGVQDYYTKEKGWCKSEYIHNIYDSPKLVETTFTSNEGWKLSELFRQFYLLKDMAEYTCRTPAGCHITTSPIEQDTDKMKEWHEYINKVMIPKITDEIMRMLTPASEVKDE